MDEYCDHFSQPCGDRASHFLTVLEIDTHAVVCSQIWIHVPFERKDKETGEAKPILRVVLDKKSMINLVRSYNDQAETALIVARCKRTLSLSRFVYTHYAFRKL